MSDTTENPRDPKRTLTERELVGEDRPDWRMLIDRLHASLDTGDFVTAVRLADPQGNRACLTTWQGRD